MSLPCEICGPAKECTCPPCDCVWCRHARGETTADESRMVAAHEAAFRRADKRRKVRAMTSEMGRALRRYKSEQ